MRNPLRLIIVTSLALGGIFGIAGSLVDQRPLQSIFWTIDGVGLIVATALLAVQNFRGRSDAVAAGFLVFCIGESVMLSGTATSLAASVPSFAAGIALWSAAFLLTAIPRHFALFTRLVAIVAAVLCATTSVRIFWGAQLLPISRPLPFFAYPFVVLTFAGWIAAQFRVQSS